MTESSDVVRLVAGAFRDPVLALWPGDRVTDYLMAPPARRHVWHAWLAARGEQVAADPDAAQRRLAGTSAAELLGETFGDVPPGLLRALGRLGPLAQPVSAYADLALILRQGGSGAKLLRHADKIEARTLTVLAALPAALRQGKIAATCQAEDARYVTWLLRRAGITELPAELVGKLEGARSSRRIVSEVEQHLMAEAFPAPPFETKPPLRPITSLAMLNEVRKRFRNCLGDYTEEVLAGSHFFYLWDGDEPAVLEVTRVGALGWRSGELAGLKNASVSPATRRALAEALRDVPSLFSEDVCREVVGELDQLPPLQALAELA